MRIERVETPRADAAWRGILLPRPAAAVACRILETNPGSTPWRAPRVAATPVLDAGMNGAALRACPPRT